jgi:hypothetical protein
VTRDAPGIAIGERMPGWLDQLPGLAAGAAVWRSPMKQESNGRIT